MGEGLFISDDENVALENEDELNVETKADDVYPMSGIKVERSFFTVFELKRKFDRHDKGIVLDSDFQRRDVWKIKQKRELIESILMGLPLPIFYFNADKRGRLVVVDGRQRLTAFFEFLNGDFALNYLKILADLNKKKFSDLSELEKSCLEDYQIIAYVIQPPTPDSIQFDIFERVNRAGTSLNKQEIRNALYQGNATKLLEKLRKQKEFEKATDEAFVKDRRMKDGYILLRFLAFYLYFNEKIVIRKNNKDVHYVYKNDIDELLGLTMDYLNAADDSLINELENITLTALETTYYYIPENAFRFTEVADDGTVIRRYPININIFEMLLYMMTLLPKKADLKGYICKSVANLKQSDELKDSIHDSRDSYKKYKRRYDLVMQIIKGIEGIENYDKNN